jgi:formate hydrogenlyase subunit 6/NADH:ubiquinone oxidoreductase subunit I
MWLEAYHVLDHPMSLSPSNYRVQNDNAKCKACGLCVKRCPMEAQHLEEHPEANNKFGKVSTVEIEKCIGCGVCVYTCPVEALTLERRETTEDPPKNPEEFVTRFITDALAGQAKKAEAAK